MIALGKSLRVPRAALEKLCGGPLNGSHDQGAEASDPKPRRRKSPRIPQDGLPLEP